MKKNIEEGQGDPMFPKDPPFFGKGKKLKKDLLYSKKMPYDIVKEGRCWMVINKKSKKVHAKCTTKKNAQAQIRILEEKKGGKCVGICEGEGFFDKKSSLPPAEPKNKDLEDLLKTFYDKIHATNLPKARVLELYQGALVIKANKKMAPQDKILVLKALMAEDHLEKGVNTNNPVSFPKDEPSTNTKDTKDVPKMIEKGTGVKKTSSWITYVKKHMTGMKGKSQQEIRDHMRKLAKDYKASK